MKTKTITVQIGNSDNKLGQARWSNYAHSINDILSKSDAIVHFSGCSDPLAEWQNAAWVFCCDGKTAGEIRNRITILRNRFEQDAVAWTEGQTIMV